MWHKGHFAKECFSKTYEPSYKSPVTGYSSVSKGFQPKFTLKLIQSSRNSISQADPKVQKDYKDEYKKMKAKLVLLEANPSMSQTPKTFQPKKKGLVIKIFDWDEKEVSDDEEVTQVKVLMALADDELIVEKNHARNVSPVFINYEKYILVVVDEYSSYFHAFGCLVFIHNHKDHLGKLDAKANDGYFLGYYFILKAFRVFNTRRQQVEETYHVIFDESMEAIRFTKTSEDEIRINESSRHPLDEFIHEDDPSR
nr:retrovirus-related Pol polyprotein from transposon TNT 1-94 [Tanacetum cinerariifolium]